MEARTPKIPGRDHPITIEPAGQRIIVRVGDQVVADTTAALTLREAGYRPVHYIPIKDLDQTMLRPGPTSTYCPYKGDASYYSIAGPDRLIEDAISRAGLGVDDLTLCRAPVGDDPEKPSLPGAEPVGNGNAVVIEA